MQGIHPAPNSTSETLAIFKISVAIVFHALACGQCEDNDCRSGDLCVYLLADVTVTNLVLDTVQRRTRFYSTCFPPHKSTLSSWSIERWRFTLHSVHFVSPQVDLMGSPENRAESCNYKGVQAGSPCAGVP